MSIYRCEKCGCVENTAVSRYWVRGDKPALCSDCDPEIKKWHGIFPKESAVGYLLGNDGFLYHKQDKKNLQWRIANQGLRLKEIKGEKQCKKTSCS